MTDKERMEENWRRVRAQIINIWGEMDESALKKTRGNLGKLVHLIHDKTGEDRMEIMQKISAVI